MEKRKHQAESSYTNTEKKSPETEGNNVNNYINCQPLKHVKNLFKY